MIVHTFTSGTKVPGFECRFSWRNPLLGLISLSGKKKWEEIVLTWNAIKRFKCDDIWKHLVLFSSLSNVRDCQ